MTTVLDEVPFVINLYSFPLFLVSQANPFFPKVSHLPPPPNQDNFQNSASRILLTPLFWGYINSHYRTNKMANSLAYHPFFTISLKDISFHISINNLMHYTCLSFSLDYLFKFLSNFYIPPCVKKVFNFMEFIFVENALIQGIFTHVPSHSTPSPLQVLVFTP